MRTAFVMRTIASVMVLIGLESLVLLHIGLSAAGLVIGGTAGAFTREAARATPVGVEVSASSS